MRVRTFDHSSRLAALAAALTVVPAAFGLAGCSSTANPPGGSSTTTTTAPTSTSAAATTTTSGGNSVSTSVEIGNSLEYGSFNTTATLDCANGKSLNVAGSNNTLTVTGTCETVSIGGTGNKITIHKINTRITVLGVENTITYKDGDPKVDNIGTNNNIKKGS
ncbi:MAG: DUF3060 domain-containing protein [Mycobacterium sp.]|uniref:DUF3060 domain-containing protein n=1 Tax=Mycobacterium sp. TaxID=1785 RepID=UPI003C501733